jgi:hypothetical protein
MIAFHTTRHTVPARTGDHDTAAAQMRNVKNGTLTTMNVNGITTDTEKQRDDRTQGGTGDMRTHAQMSTAEHTATRHVYGGHAESA